MNRVASGPRSDCPISMIVLCFRFFFSLSFCFVFSYLFYNLVPFAFCPFVCGLFCSHEIRLKHADNKQKISTYTHKIHTLTPTNAQTCTCQKPGGALARKCICMYIQAASTNFLISPLQRVQHSSIPTPFGGVLFHPHPLWQDTFPSPPLMAGPFPTIRDVLK